MFEQGPFLFPEHPGPGRPHLRAEGPGGLCGAGQVQPAEVVDDNRFENISLFFFSGKSQVSLCRGDCLPWAEGQGGQKLRGGEEEVPGGEGRQVFYGNNSPKCRFTRQKKMRLSFFLKKKPGLSSSSFSPLQSGDSGDSGQASFF